MSGKVLIRANDNLDFSLNLATMNTKGDRFVIPLVVHIFWDLIPKISTFSPVQI